MQKNNKPEMLLLILMLVVISLLITMSIMDSIIKNSQIEQLRSSVMYLSDKCNQLEVQNDRQQRQINQDYLILSQGWKD